MKPKEFVQKFKDDALRVEVKTGISHIAILAQAALESGWGECAPGNMFFGVKDHDGINGNEQLITTTEYHNTVNVKYPVIISIKPVVIRGKKKFKYTVKDYFRKFETPEACFDHHAQFFLKSKIYQKAMIYKSDYSKFFDEIAKAGYATGPEYATVLKNIAKTIMKNL